VGCSHGRFRFHIETLIHVWLNKDSSRFECVKLLSYNKCGRRIPIWIHSTESTYTENRLYISHDKKNVVTIRLGHMIRLYHILRESISASWNIEHDEVRGGGTAGILNTTRFVVVALFAMGGPALIITSRLFHIAFTKTSTDSYLQSFQLGWTLHGSVLHLLVLENCIVNYGEVSCQSKKM